MSPVRRSHRCLDQYHGSQIEIQKVWMSLCNMKQGRQAPSLMQNPGSDDADGKEGLQAENGCFRGNWPPAVACRA